MCDLYYLHGLCFDASSSTLWDLPFLSITFEIFWHLEQSPPSVNKAGGHESDRHTPVTRREVVPASGCFLLSAGIDKRKLDLEFPGPPAPLKFYLPLHSQDRIIIQVNLS